MDTLVNNLRKFRLLIKDKHENFSHAATIFNANLKERCVKGAKHRL